MIAYEAGGLVKSLAGHDKDQYFIILADGGEYVTLVDGLSRKLDNPKRKNKKHVQPTHQKDEVLNKKIINGLPVTDEEIRAVVRKAEKRQRQPRLLIRV